MELPILITRLDGREDVLIIQTYLIDAEILFLCGKQTLENWNFKIDGRAKILEIQSKMDGSMMKLKMIDTSGGHYGKKHIVHIFSKVRNCLSEPW